MKEYRIDFSKAKSIWEAHEVIRIGLNLPEWYGKNLDALWDSVTGLIQTPCTIFVQGKDTVPKNIQAEVNEMVNVLLEAKSEYKDIYLQIMQ